MRAEIKKIEKADFHKHNFLAPLLEISQCPTHLFYKGNIPEKKDGVKIISFVGSRKCTTYGKEVTKFLINNLPKDKVMIVSGLAVGIDSMSHEMAILNNIKTIAFPGSGLGDTSIYPQSNVKLAKKIFDNSGALFSEWEEDQKSQTYFFPARNRLMAAVSDLVIVIEAQEKSGSQITARLGLEYNKEVAIVPGSIFSSYSRGTLNLLKDGAHPITSADDICSILGIKTGETGKLDLKNSSFTDEEKIILEMLESPMGKDEIIEGSGLDIDQVLSTLISLESRGIIVDQFGEIKKLL
jgi:DNA processing protein